jgi:hypothetical protein
MILMLMLTNNILTEGLLMMDDHFFVVSHFKEVPNIKHIRRLSQHHTIGCKKTCRRRQRN